jgi:hypothetical protein
MLHPNFRLVRSGGKGIGQKAQKIVQLNAPLNIDQICSRSFCAFCDYFLGRTVG